MCVQLQVLQDLSSYESKAQSNYNPIRPPIIIDTPMPPPPRPPPGPPSPIPFTGPPPTTPTPGPPAGPDTLSRRKRNVIFCPGFRRGCWPYFSGGTNSFEVFEVAYIFCY